MKVLVRGSGDVASAVAHRLFALGHQVAIHDVAQPAYIRRGMSFTDAVFEGKVQLQGTWAKRVATRADLNHMLRCGRAIPLVLDSFEESLPAIRPDVLVDARMRKQTVPESQRHYAGLTIGLGPNFVAGEQTDVVIETAWEALGRIIYEGPSLPLAGEPRQLGGVGRERCLYAPAAGVVIAEAEIGVWKNQGEAVARLGTLPLCAPISGYVRGICRSGVEVAAGAKVLEMDPRREDANLFGLGERPLRIAEAVAQVVVGAS